MKTLTDLALKKGEPTEAGDSARIYFVEISYSTANKEVEFAIHGVEKRDVTTIAVEQFFKNSENKWDWKFLKTSNVVIPLFIYPMNIDKSTENVAGKINIETFAKLIAGGFKSKQCYLYKPVYAFNQSLHMDIEQD